MLSHHTSILRSATPIPVNNGPRSQRPRLAGVSVIVWRKRDPTLTENDRAGAVHRRRPVHLRTLLSAGGLVLAVALVSVGAFGTATPTAAHGAHGEGPRDRAAALAIPRTRSTAAPRSSSLPSSTLQASAAQPSGAAAALSTTSAPMPPGSPSSTPAPASVRTPAPTSPPPPTTVAAPPPTTVPSLPFPIRAAFYYPWFPEGWDQQGLDPFTKYHPSLGLYSQDDANVVADQIQAMQYGNIQVGIASWWGQGSPTDGRIPLLLQEAAGTGFKWTLYYEAGGNAIPGEAGSPNPTVAQIRSDLTYIKNRYASNPSYLHVDGKPVIFVYGGPTTSCTTTDRLEPKPTLSASTCR